MSILHLTQGDDLTNNLKSLDLPGEIIVWREMLCEGPTCYRLDTNDSINKRTEFLKNSYKISSADYHKQFVDELNKLSIINGYDEIVLWFEFDLFSHMNMMAAISHLLEHRKNIPISLVCSKKLEGEKEFSPLSQLRTKHLKNHYDQRIELKKDDLLKANLIWQLYNGDNPDKLKNQITAQSNFEYLSNCIRAHIERFPNAKTGLNSMEQNVLKLIKKYNITSINQLTGYALGYQGYFGMGHMQVKRMIEKLNMFYEVKNDKVELTKSGEEALTESKNFYRELKNEEYFGGVKMYDFLYDADSHSLLKL